MQVNNNGFKSYWTSINSTNEEEKIKKAKDNLARISKLAEDGFKNYKLSFCENGDIDVDYDGYVRSVRGPLNNTAEWLGKPAYRVSDWNDKIHLLPIYINFIKDKIFLKNIEKEDLDNLTKFNIGLSHLFNTYNTQGKEDNKKIVSLAINDMKELTIKAYNEYLERLKRIDMSLKEANYSEEHEYRNLLKEIINTVEKKLNDNLEGDEISNDEISNEESPMFHQTNEKSTEFEDLENIDKSLELKGYSADHKHRQTINSYKNNIQAKQDLEKSNIDYLNNLIKENPILRNNASLQSELKKLIDIDKLLELQGYPEIHEYRQEIKNSMHNLLSTNINEIEAYVTSLIANNKFLQFPDPFLQHEIKNQIIRVLENEKLPISDEEDLLNFLEACYANFFIDDLNGRLELLFAALDFFDLQLLYDISNRSRTEEEGFSKKELALEALKKNEAKKKIDEYYKIYSDFFNPAIQDSYFLKLIEEKQRKLDSRGQSSYPDMQEIDKLLAM